MTTASLNTVIDNTSDAGFRTWGNELMTMLITTLGLTQTADTGQLAFPMTVTTRPAINTAAGYYILRFNDTLQATSPVFIKVELGSGATQTHPAVWITIGTGSNGSGTLTGLGTRVACWYASNPSSTVTNFTSRGCYNATQGVLWVDMKQAGPGTNTSQYGFMICRSVDNTGAPTATAVGLMSNSATASGGTSAGGVWQWIDYSNSTIYGPATAGGFTFGAWGTIPYLAATSTVFGTAGQVFPCFQFAPTASTPPFGISNVYALALQSEISTGSTVTLTILGSTSLTYISTYQPNSNYTTNNSYALNTYGMLRLWQ